MALSDDLARMRAGRPRRIDRAPITAVVVLVDDAGDVWCAPLGEDTRSPIGPCRGGVRRGSGGATSPVEVGAAVLLIWTENDRPWIAAWEEI